MNLGAYRETVWSVLLVTLILLVVLMFNYKYFNESNYKQIGKLEQKKSDPHVQVNIIMMQYSRTFQGIYATGFEYQLNKHLHDYHCTPNCKDGSNITVSIDHVVEPKYLTRMNETSNYWIHYQTEQCLREKDNHTYFPLGQTFPNAVDLLLDWSQRYVSMKDKCYPHVKRAAALNFDATIDPIYLENSINYFKNISTSTMNYNYNDQTFDQLRDIDVALFGNMGDPRKIRSNFCDNIKSKYPTLKVDCTPKFLDELISKLKRSKVCINLHHYPQASLETHRINQCILWKVAVISERSGDSELDRKYEQEYGVTFVDFIDVENDKNGLDNFIDKVKQLVDNKQKRFQATELAYQNIVKLNQEKNEQICQIAKSIKCHYPNDL